MPANKKLNKDRVKDKSYSFLFMLYLDNDYTNLLLLEFKSFRYNVLAILHDKDRYTDTKIDEETGELIHSEGDLKKPHYHVYIQFPNRRYIKGVSEELGIPEHLIQFCEGSFKENAEYFLHWGKYGGDGKHTYDPDEFIGSLKSSAKAKLVNEPIDLKLTKIVRYIDSCDGFINERDVYNWCAENGYIGLWLNKLNAITKLCYCHNEDVTRAKKHLTREEYFNMN